MIATMVLQPEVSLSGYFVGLLCRALKLLQIPGTYPTWGLLHSGLLPADFRDEESKFSNSEFYL